MIIKPTEIISHGTVLFANNGFLYDSPMLLTEIERRPNRPLSTQHFVSRSIHFTNTLPRLRQVHSNQSLLFVRSGRPRFVCAKRSAAAKISSGRRDDNLLLISTNISKSHHISKRYISGSICVRSRRSVCGSIDWMLCKIIY